jgi:putative ABC transport system substrate-binding protein
MTVPVTMLSLVVPVSILLVAPIAAEAQQTGKMPRIGYLSIASAPDTHEGFRQGLRELGYIEGQNITVEVRYAAGKADRLPELAAELVRLEVDVIVAVGTPDALVAKKATQTIPIITVASGDPVGSGLVASLARPGGNVTGLSSSPGPEMSSKQLELLKEAVPKLTHVVVLANPANPPTAALLREAERAARSLGVQLRIIEVRGPNDLDTAFSAIAQERASALLVIADPVVVNNRSRIVAFAASIRLPAMYPYRLFVGVGGLMSYGVNIPDLARRAATYADKILKGAKPGDLPVEQPTKFELVINTKTAKALGLTIPRSLLLRADEVIQ